MVMFLSTTARTNSHMTFSFLHCFLSSDSQQLPQSPNVVRCKRCKLFSSTWWAFGEVLWHLHKIDIKTPSMSGTFGCQNPPHPIWLWHCGKIHIFVNIWSHLHTLYSNWCWVESVTTFTCMSKKTMALLLIFIGKGKGQLANPWIGNFTTLAKLCCKPPKPLSCSEEYVFMKLLVLCWTRNLFLPKQPISVHFFSLKDVALNNKLFCKLTGTVHCMKKRHISFKWKLSIRGRLGPCAWADQRTGSALKMAKTAL